MGSPENRWIQQLEQLLNRAALGMSFEGRRHNGDDALLDGGEADILLVNQEEPVISLQNNLSAARTNSGVLLFDQTKQGIETRVRWLDVGQSTVFRRWFRVELVHLMQALASTLQGLQHPSPVKGLKQIIDGVHVESTHRILIKGSGEDDLRHGVRVVALQQLLQHGKAVEARHLHVQKHYIRMVSTNQVDRLDAVLALGDDLNPSRRVQKVFEFFAREPFIVDDERSHGHGLLEHFHWNNVPPSVTKGFTAPLRIERHGGERAYYPRPSHGRNRRNRRR